MGGRGNADIIAEAIVGCIILKVRGYAVVVNEWQMADYNPIFLGSGIRSADRNR